MPDFIHNPACNQITSPLFQLAILFWPFSRPLQNKCSTDVSAEKSGGSRFSEAMLLQVKRFSVQFAWRLHQEDIAWLLSSVAAADCIESRAQRGQGINAKHHRFTRRPIPYSIVSLNLFDVSTCGCSIAAELLGIRQIRRLGITYNLKIHISNSATVGKNVLACNAFNNILIYFVLTVT